MRRVAVILGLTALIATAGVLAGAANGEHYKVRAIFDSAAFVVKGEDVKIAGVRVGQIDSLEVTEDKKAAVVLDITDPGFQDFRADATCKIRPQSLIGEQFVECSPTQPRASTDQPAPKLERLDNGEYLLPSKQTSTSVALDLIGDTARLPVRQRLTLIINELGTGLAGRGDDLNQVIRQSAPALQELDKVLKLLASQNKTLKQLAADSDASIAPLAREREHVTGFITASQKTAAATAERRQALAQSLQKLPRFLAELRPTMRRLGELADQTTPVVSDLHASAADINELLRQMGPFSKAATPALVALGRVGEPGIPALRASLPITKDLNSFAKRLKPVAATLADVLDSFQRNDGIEYLMDYVFYQAMAVNGFDTFGHFLRAGLLVNTCSTYAVQPQDECISKFSNPPSTNASARSLSGLDIVLQRTAAVLRGEDPDDVLRRTGGQETKTGPKTQRTRTQPQVTATATPSPSPSPTSTPQVAPAAPAPSATPDSGTVNDVMDYLFGKDGL
jgi:phospholipid/cholesterol/gamma-HCH transport system substrate-binding protein